MKNAEYWDKRIASNTWKTYNSIEDKNKALIEMYDKATADIQNELFALAMKFKGGDYTRSDIYKFNRLNKLNKKIVNIVEELGDKVQEHYINNAIEGYKAVYKQIALQLDLEFTEVPQKALETLLYKEWKGSNFSKRLWDNNDRLVKELKEILVNGINQGKTFIEMAYKLKGRMNKDLDICHRLVRTETMHYLNVSAQESYKDCGIKQVQFWSATDERTCPSCGALHGNIYDINNAPTPPTHANCRCTLLPITDMKVAKKDYENAKEEIEKIQGKSK